MTAHLALDGQDIAAPDAEGGGAKGFEITADDAALQHARETLHIGARQLFVAWAWLPSGPDVLALEQAAGVLLAAAP